MKDLETLVSEKGFLFFKIEKRAIQVEIACFVAKFQFNRTVVVLSFELKF